MDVERGPRINPYLSSWNIYCPLSHLHFPSSMSYSANSSCICSDFTCMLPFHISINNHALQYGYWLLPYTLPTPFDPYTDCPDTSEPTEGDIDIWIGQSVYGESKIFGCRETASSSAPATASPLPLVSFRAAFGCSITFTFWPMCVWLDGSNGSGTSEDLFWKLDALQTFIRDLHWPEEEFAKHLENRIKLMSSNMIENCVKRWGFVLGMGHRTSYSAL